MPRRSLGDLCHIIRGTYPTLSTEPGPYPLVVTASHRRTASSYQLEGPGVCVPLISSTGHGDAALHRVHYQEGKYALANLLVALVPRDPATCLAKYLYYLLQAQKDRLFVPLMSGTANVSLKERDIAAVEIELPSPAEQVRVVGLLDAVVVRIEETRRLRDDADIGVEKLLISMAHRGDLGENEKIAAGWRSVTLRDIIRLVEDPRPVVTDASYPNLGIYSFGRGLFPKAAIDGLLTSARTLFRVKAGQFIYSRLFAFEGAYGVVGDEFDGHFVSNEYPTFECDREQVRVEFLEAYFKSPQVWAAVASGSKGLGDRRQRVHPDQVLGHRLLVPPVWWQDRLAAVRSRIASLKPAQADTMPKLDSMLTSTLDLAFKGSL